MLMRRPVSCSDPAKGIILAEIKFRNLPRSTRDDSRRAFAEETLANHPSRHYGNHMRLSQRSLLPLRSLQLRTMVTAITVTVCIEKLRYQEMQIGIFRRRAA